MMRDQSYISGLGRVAEDVGRNLVKADLIPAGNGGRGDDRGEGGSGGGARLDEKSDKELRLVREAEREGVRLVLLPKGMERRRINGSRWDPK